MPENVLSCDMAQPLLDARQERDCSPHSSVIKMLNPSMEGINFFLAHSCQK